MWSVQIINMISGEKRKKISLSPKRGKRYEVYQNSIFLAM